MTTALFAIALAAVVLVRFIRLAARISGAEYRRTHGGPRWHGFALSYIALAGAACFGALDVAKTGGSIAVWLFLLASAGLVLFDNRRPWQ